MLHLLGFRVASGLVRPVALLLGGLVALVLSATAAPGRAAGLASGRAPLAAAQVTQGFGCTWVALEPYEPACPSHHFHSGIDLAAPNGTPVYSVVAGMAVVVASPTGYGLHVVVDAGGGLTVLYGHLSGFAVRPGEPVSAGALLGWVGSTGNSTGPHLHFEVRRGGVPVDPSPWLPEYGAPFHQGGGQRWSTKSS